MLNVKRSTVTDPRQMIDGLPNALLDLGPHVHRLVQAIDVDLNSIKWSGSSTGTASEHLEPSAHKWNWTEASHLRVKLAGQGCGKRDGRRAFA